MRSKNQLIHLAGQLVRCDDDASDQPLRCRAATALHDASDKIKQLQAIVDKLPKWADELHRIVHSTGVVLALQKLEKEIREAAQAAKEKHNAD